MLSMFLLFWLGLFLRKRWHILNLEPKSGVLAVQSALLALFGFILAFTFSMSGNRYEYVRNVYIDESNAIGTAVLRSNLYSDSVSKIFRSHFKEYLDARITMYENPGNPVKVSEGKSRSGVAADELWQLAMQQSKKTRHPFAHKYSRPDSVHAAYACVADKLYRGHYLRR
jgi:hypothetical protein